jgi:hypothetical protein
MVETLARLEKGLLEKRTESTVPRHHEGNAVMDILDLMQRALDRTNDPDAIFALDRGITEIERLTKLVDNQRRRYTKLQKIHAEYVIKTTESSLKGRM